MAHFFLEFRDNANVESQVGVMLTFIYSCGSKVNNVRKVINVYQWMDGWVGRWVGGGREGGTERERVGEGK